uniref:Ribonuclease A-domain domain-containing protein n=1 Tax=Electrophorus electricus TaxID=8005 RepID=A0A4W4DPU3_ELEEL
MSQYYCRINAYCESFSLLWLALTLLLVLCVIPYTDAQTEKEFIKKHVRPHNLLQDSCNESMQEINGRGNCKPINTFILDNISNVRQVCSNGRYLDIRLWHNNYYKYYESNRNFNIVNCTLIRNSKPPICRYKHINGSEHIFVACDQNDRPVHYGQPRPHTNENHAY